MRAGIYVRISTLDQHAANQLPELHKYVADRGWDAQEFVDRRRLRRKGLLDDLQAMGVGIISLREGLDWTTPSGRLQAQLLAMIAEFERARLRERVLAGLARARRDGKRLGRPRRQVTARDLAQVPGLSVRAAARELKVSPSVLQRARHDAAGEAQYG